MGCGRPAPDPDSPEFASHWEQANTGDGVICLECMVEAIKGPLGDLYDLRGYEAEVADLDALWDA